MTVVGVGWNGTSNDIDEFVSRHGLTFTNVHDVDGAIFSSFGVFGQPAWVFQGSTGAREIVLGALSADQLDKRMTTLVADN